MTNLLKQKEERRMRRREGRKGKKREEDDRREMITANKREERGGKGRTGKREILKTTNEIAHIIFKGATIIQRAIFLTKKKIKTRQLNKTFMSLGKCLLS